MQQHTSMRRRAALATPMRLPSVTRRRRPSLAHRLRRRHRVLRRERGGGVRGARAVEREALPPEGLAHRPQRRPVELVEGEDVAQRRRHAL